MGGGGGPRSVARRTDGAAGAIDGAISTSPTTVVAAWTATTGTLATGVCCVTAHVAHGAAVCAWKWPLATSGTVSSAARISDRIVRTRRLRAVVTPRLSRSA